MPKHHQQQYILSFALQLKLPAVSSLHVASGF
jgi:hypothetical protein